MIFNVFQCHFGLIGKQRAGRARLPHSVLCHTCHHCWIDCAFHAQVHVSSTILSLVLLASHAQETRRARIGKIPDDDVPQLDLGRLVSTGETTVSGLGRIGRHTNTPAKRLHKVLPASPKLSTSIQLYTKLMSDIYTYYHRGLELDRRIILHKS